MHTIERLRAEVQAGNSVTLDGKTFAGANLEGFDDAYTAEKAKYDEANAQKPVYGGAQATVAPDSTKAEYEALVKRNGEQADLIDALGKNPAVFKDDKAALSALAKFEGVEFDGRANAETILKAISDKRGA